MEVAYQRQLELASINATPVASVGVAMMSVAGGKAKDEWFNPYATLLFQQEAKKACFPVDAKLFLSLANSGKLPSWVVSHVDIKLIEAAAK